MGDALIERRANTPEEDGSLRAGRHGAMPPQRKSAQSENFTLNLKRVKCRRRYE